MVIEPAAAALLAARRCRPDLDDLSGCVEHLVGLVESDVRFRDADAWSPAAQRFHDLILERAGNRALAVQAGVLREVVAMHLSTVVLRTVATRVIPNALSAERSRIFVTDAVINGPPPHIAQVICGHREISTTTATRGDLTRRGHRSPPRLHLGDAGMPAPAGNT